MKLKLILLLAIFAAGYAEAQIRKIPAEVTDAFKARYPHAEKVEWRDELTSFEAQFTLNGFKMTADFNSKGEWQNSDKKLKYEDLPASVKDGFEKSKFTDWEKHGAVEIDKSGEALEYRIFIKKSSVQKKYLFFDADGKLKREALTL